MDEKQTLAIEFADEELEALIVYHKSNDKRYRKLKSNATFLKDLDAVMAIIRSATNTFEEFDGGIRIKLIEINEHYGDK